MCRALHTFGLYLLVLLLQHRENHGAFYKWTNTVCESYNESWVRIEYCRLKAVSRYVVHFNLNVTFLHPANDISLRFQILKKANGYKPWIIDYTVDACDLVMKHNHPYLNLFLKHIREFSTINHTCPYVGTQLVQNFYVNPEKITLLLPPGEYAFILTWSFKKRKQFITKLYALYTERL